jgi:uncharacterized membrane protein YuzA (DUF378 family)
MAGLLAASAGSHPNSTAAVRFLYNYLTARAQAPRVCTNPIQKEVHAVRKFDTLALILTIVGGLNWGLVGLFRFDLVAAIFGGMEFGETNLASRIVYAAVGLSAVYLLGRIRALVGDQERVPSTA